MRRTNGEALEARAKAAERRLQEQEETSRGLGATCAELDARAEAATANYLASEDARVKAVHDLTKRLGAAERERDIWRRRAETDHDKLARVRELCKQNVGAEQDWTSVVGFAHAILAVVDGEIRSDR